MKKDAFNLQRFVTAQNSVYQQVLLELKSGRKESCWMWFVFPQIVGLGNSWESRTYGISGSPEAEAYLAHPILGPRLIECSRLAISAPSASADEIFGSTDAMKFRSSMTLFARVADDPAIFQQAIEKYFRGQPDALTVARL
jgi:uncharacterized protein (DUF1810 family)